MLKTSARRKGKTNQSVGTRKTEVNAKGKHVETREEAAACSAQDLRRGIEWSLRAFASVRALRFLLRARAMIEFVLRAASTLENTTGEQRALRSPLAAILFLVISNVVFITFIRVRVVVP